MVTLHGGGVFLQEGKVVTSSLSAEAARENTIAYQILRAHNTAPDMKNLKIRFDSLTSHDITYVGIIQTARASGMTEFPMPYVLTNCHNSLCAVGGTINEDDHRFALSAAHKYGGIYVPTNLAVIHSYNREMMAGCGKMILGSDSHTRYGALGTLAVGEGGGELAKQLLSRTYDLPAPGVVAVRLRGKPRKGVGPQDVALAIIGAVYANGFVKNKVMEFIGDGIAGLPVEYRNGIDVMTTETACWSSIWQTDDEVKSYLAIHGRADGYKELLPRGTVYYDGMIDVALDTVEPMIALPFHPSNAFTIANFNENAGDILRQVERACEAQFPEKGIAPDLTGKLRDGVLHVDQGIVAGCSGGTFDNICAVADVLKGKTTGNGAYTLSVYPGSQPAYLALTQHGVTERLMKAGVILRECFCGPCFGAGDTPANGAFSIRHTTRNFLNREGSKPGEGQLSCVALMDARSIAATTANGGRLTSALDMPYAESVPRYSFDEGIYAGRVYNGFGKAKPEQPLEMGPNIKDWPTIPALKEHLLLKVVSCITDAVTTTDELIPSGETASFRSNPLRLAEFTLSRKDPGYVARAKAFPEPGEAAAVLSKLGCGQGADTVSVGSTIYAVMPGDGSAREQAASCQRVLGAAANIAKGYATKRYRSNLLNWGMLPFEADAEVALGEYVYVPNVRRAIIEGWKEIPAKVVGEGPMRNICLSLGTLTEDERQILLAGCIINFYRA